MHKPIIAVVGPSGSGKSTSLRNLNPETTQILDGEMKGWPFVGAAKFPINTFANPQEFETKFRAVLALPKTELIIIESLTKLLLGCKQTCVLVNKGFEIWSSYARMVRTYLNMVKNDKAIVVFTSIDYIEQIPQPDGSTVAKRMIAVEGNEIPKQGGIEPDMLCVLFTDVRKGKDNIIQYQFETNNDGVTTAKTPMGLFDSRYIPNDLNLVVETIKQKLLA